MLETTLFPAWDVLPTESDRPAGLALAGRRRTLERLLEILVAPPEAVMPRAWVIVAPVTALMQPVEAPDDTRGALRLSKGDERDPIALGRLLADMGFDRVGQAEVRGEYSLRGGILDIFPYSLERPVRIDFFGEMIESIHPFNPLSQVSEEAVESVSIADSSPARLRKLFSPGAASPWTLLEHLPVGTHVVWIDPAKLAQRAELYHASLISGRSVCVTLDMLRERAQYKFDALELLPPEAETVVAAAHTAASSERSLKTKVAQSKSSPHQAQPAVLHEVACTSLQRLHGEVRANADSWRRLAASCGALYVFCATPGDRVRMEQLLTEAHVLPAPTVRFHIGMLSGGFDLRTCGMACISDREILGRRRQALAVTRTGPTVSDSRPIASILDLQAGDYVVHVAHGIARYLGFARLEKSGRMEDYLMLLFDEGVKLYVPAAHVSLVSKYIGSQVEPGLSKLGGKAWARKKARAQRLMKDIAEDLLRVQAARRSLPGIVYGPDGEWQEAFEAAFPYEETPDQLTAFAAVKADMQATYPMDRLLCGDVGFGKTEVALRAVFRAVMNGKQATVLAPTTLLCAQHGHTFVERFAGYPVSVETLSRFKTVRQQSAILQRLAAGRVDVVIGTHRLLQKDVRFKDLGLVVIDEEQRFGVEHKEFFKQLRKSVDVLTLSATPVPRTLHMAMLGLRDISNLRTPPRNRRPIQTQVARMNDDLLRRAILREVSRGGQVFIVHPRVHDIDAFAARLATLVPEARFAVGHGQLDAGALEDVMAQFIDAQVDVLVSTTIIESGLDISRANTILVHDAGRFGLAELHQLRGRVGRADIQAYCYLLLPEASPVTPEGLRRLRALEEFDELGAGFQLALKDLEIRGAGNVLGVEQSGAIADVGYDLYCKLLESTVRAVKGEEPPEEEIEVALQLRGAAYIPDTYIEDEKAVLECYRRLTACSTDQDLQVLKSVLTDRFGQPPEPVTRLFDEARLRKLARSARVPYIGMAREESRLVMRLYGWDLKMADRALRGLPEAKDVRILDGETLTFGLSLAAKHHEAALYESVRHVLEPLVVLRKKCGLKVVGSIRN